jgi:atypical dual specificity phosphatase
MVKNGYMGERLNFSWLIEGKVAGHGAPKEALDLVYLKEKGIRALVWLAERREPSITMQVIQESGFKLLYEPIPDLEAPRQDQIARIIAFINQSLVARRPTGISCQAGLGRTGTILVCYLVSLGLKAEAAIRKVRSQRPGSIETWEQEKSVHSYAAKPARD